MDEDFKLSGILFVMLLVISVWFWHDHNEMSKKLDDANSKFTQMQNAEQSKLDELKKTEDDKTTAAANLQICLDNADTNYSAAFDNNCRAEGTLNCDTNPTVYQNTENELEANRYKDKELCFKQFPQH